MSGFERLQLYYTSRSWRDVVRLVAIGVAIIVIFFTQSFLVTWQLPAPKDITKVSGSFTDEHTALYPYTFAMDDGVKMYLGCTPGTHNYYCLEASRVWTPALIGAHVTIEYYQVPYPWWRIYKPGSPIVLISVERDGHPIFSFEQSHAQLLGDRAIQLNSRYIALFFMLGGVLVLMLAMRISYAKLIKVRERAGHA